MTADRSPLENLLLRDRLIVVGGLGAIVLLSWLYLLRLVQDMAAGDMRLMGMGQMGQMGETMGEMAMASHAWSTTTFVLMLAMWWIMMIAMMVPSAAPMILLYARVLRKKLPDASPLKGTSAFAGGYLLGWLGFSLAATLAQWGLSEAALLTPMMEANSTLLGVVIFAAAGLYQMTPLKQACLKHCQSPFQFLSSHWRGGRGGALVMGLAHGAYCVGCCWVLMALLFVGGVMNLAWVAAIAAFVLLEKLLPPGRWFAIAAGVGLIGFAAILMLS